MRVLVLDCEYRLALAAVRSLGRHGAEVVAAARSPRALAFRSRRVASRVLQPRSDDDLAEFVVRTARARGVDVVLPLGQESTAALAAEAEAVHAVVAAALPPAEALAVASSKRRTLELANEVGVATPAPVSRSHPTFPAVAKADLGAGQVRYLNDRADLAGIPPDWIVQEYVPGEGRGFFALFEHGVERAVFMHRRVREFPVTGGASTAAEPIDDQELRLLGLRLLRELSWHGVAMVEFKLDERDGTYKLMEINPKFWGSLDLAIAAGIDFPWLAVQLAVGQAPLSEPTARSGFRYQWVFPDLLHVAASPRAAPAVLADLLDPRVKNDLRLSDPKPSAVEAAYTAVALWRRARARTLRRPHGAPDGR